MNQPGILVLSDFINQLPSLFDGHARSLPWELTANLTDFINEMILELDDNFEVNAGIAIHKTAIVEDGVILRSPVIISENCFVGANTYLRGGVFLDKEVKIGPGCEIKSSIICTGSSMAHFNFIGDSLIGQHVNFEAGAVTANHYNERENKNIYVIFDAVIMDTTIQKFGSLVGDHSKIGANAVLSPGTLLLPGTVVKRLELIEQIK